MYQFDNRYINTRITLTTIFNFNILTNENRQTKFYKPHFQKILFSSI